jgi:hypothetical protein
MDDGRDLLEAITSRLNRLKGYLGLIIFILVSALIPIGDRMIYGANGAAHFQILLREFSAIKAPPFMGLVRRADSYSSWRPHQALVGAEYATTAPDEVVRQFYDQALRENAWKPLSKKTLTDWGADRGGYVMDYCKESLKASLQYAGPKSAPGWTYSFSVSWGLIAKGCR